MSTRHQRPLLLTLWRARIALASIAALVPAGTAGFGLQEPAHAPATAVEPALEPELARRLEDLAAALERERVDLHLPGLALAIVLEDRLVFARGFGLADVEHARPVTPETIFAIGSTTKAFTATLVGMLADADVVEFDDPVTEHLPWFVLPVDGKRGAVAKLRDLLSHRTGFANMDILWAGGRASREEVLRTAMRAEPIAAFGSTFLYNNVMYLAAGEACAAAEGRTWEELVHERFFEPLGMRDSTTSITDAQKDPRLALGYEWNAEKSAFEHRPMRELGSIAPAGSINSNVLDLSRWVRFQLGRGEFEGRRLISEESLAETWKPAVKMAPDTSYGLGWMLREWRGRRYVEHGGNIDGFAAEVALLPEERLGVVMLTNVLMTPLQGTIGPKVFASVLGEPGAAAEPADAADAAGAGDLERYLGTYVANYFNFHDARFEVRLQNDRLAIDVPGQTVFELLPPDAAGKRPFALVPETIQASFVEQDGKVVELVLYQNGLAFELPREGWTPEPELTPEEVRPYLGSYADPSIKKTFAVVYSRGRLAVDYPGQMTYELRQPEADDRWVFRATDALAVEFHLDADDMAEAVTFHERGTKRMCERVGESESALPTMADVLALRHAAANEARLAELGLCRLTGTLRFVNCGVEGTTAMVFDAGGRSLDTTDLPPFMWTQVAVDGEHVRMRSTVAPERELKGASADQARAGALAALLGDWTQRFDSAVVERVEEAANGMRTARVRLVEAEAPAVILHVDLASGDVLRAEVSEIASTGGTYDKTLTFEDWREIEGLRLPMRVVSEDKVVGKVVVQYAALETRLALDEPFVLAPIPAR